MTQQEKELLLQDLCARLPYRVKAQYEGNVKEIQYIEPEFEEVCLAYPDNSFTIDVADCKPFLRPMSSMTKEERNEYHSYCDYYYGTYFDTVGSIDWLNKKMFSHRKDDEGKTMFEKGLALEAPEGMYS